MGYNYQLVNFGQRHGSGDWDEQEMHRTIQAVKLALGDASSAMKPLQQKVQALVNLSHSQAPPAFQEEDCGDGGLPAGSETGSEMGFESDVNADEPLTKEKAAKLTMTAKIWHLTSRLSRSEESLKAEKDKV